MMLGVVELALPARVTAAGTEDNQTAYLAAHAGTYVTEKDYTSGGAEYDGSEWSIEINDDGKDIKLLYNGEDTGATVTKLDGTSTITTITFSNEGEWFNNIGENQLLKVTFNSAGYIVMPTATVYNEGGAEVLYSFSKNVYMYNKTKALEYFKSGDLHGTYTLNDGYG